jgi:hypothetical protein
MSLNETSQGTDTETGLINMFKVLNCLVDEFTKTLKPVNYTAIEDCVEKRGLHGSRYIYSALKRARAMGYVRFIERKSGGTWKYYIPTLKGIVATTAFNIAFMYRAPEVYEVIMDHMASLMKLTVKTFREWKEVMDREGVNYNKDYIEGLIHNGEHLLSALREDVPSDLEELSETAMYIYFDIVPMIIAWLELLAKELEKAGVPKETIEKIIKPTSNELIEFLGHLKETSNGGPAGLMSKTENVTANQQAQDSRT